MSSGGTNGFAGATTSAGTTGVGTAGATTTGGTGSGTAGASSTAGASTGGAGSSCGPAQADCDAAMALTTMSVSDFESGNGWFLFAPDDPGAKTDPPAGSNVPIAQILCPANGRCGSDFAMHVTGSGFTSYGPSLSQDYVYQGDGGLVGMPQDFSEYTGVMYWARKGDTASAAPTLRLIVNDVNTHALGGVCDPTAKTGSASMPSNACFDGWMAEKAIPTVWTLVKLPFSVLKQGGFGKAEPAIAKDKIYGLTFQMPNMAAWDFWIDDISFYK